MRVNGSIESEFLADVAHSRNHFLAEQLEAAMTILRGDRAIEPEREDSGPQHFEHVAQLRHDVFGVPVII